MLGITCFFIELFILFLLSKKLTQLLSFFFYQVTKSRKATIYAMALFFFPGTFIHELSHYLMAIFMNVRAYDMEFMPQIREQGVKLGSVTIERTDIIRRLFIGMAPFFFGTTIIITLLYFGIIKGLFTNMWFLSAICYATFEIGNTMFSSKKDMEGAVELLGVLSIFFFILFLSGIHIPQINPTNIFDTQPFKALFEKGSQLLLIPLGLDVVSIILLSFFLKKKTLY